MGSGFMRWFSGMRTILCRRIGELSRALAWRWLFRCTWFCIRIGKLLAVVDAVFALLVVLGIVVDPTTVGVGDSKRALGYEEPWTDVK
jgi:phi LC3 family holin